VPVGAAMTWRERLVIEPDRRRVTRYRGLLWPVWKTSIPTDADVCVVVSRSDTGTGRAPYEVRLSSGCDSLLMRRFREPDSAYRYGAERAAHWNLQLVNRLASPAAEA